MFDANKATQLRTDVRAFLLEFFRENVPSNHDTVRERVYDVVNALDRLAALGPEKAGNHAVVIANGIELAWEAYCQECATTARKSPTT